MKFIKDILLFDIQATGPDYDKDPIIQLAAVLLDKDNLLEKKFFNSYVRVSLLEATISHHAQLLSIPFETMQKSAKIYDVTKNFRLIFGNDLLLGAHNVSRLLFLKQAFKKAAVPWDYNHQFLDLWTLGYLHTLHYGIKKMPTFHTFVDLFALKQKNRHNAFERVRLSGEIFRRIIERTENAYH